MRELLHTTEAATKFSNHVMGLAITFRHDLVPSTSITRETAILLHHATENLTRLASVRPARHGDQTPLTVANPAKAERTPPGGAGKAGETRAKKRAAKVSVESSSSQKDEG